MGDGLDADGKGHIREVHQRAKTLGLSARNPHHRD